MSQNVIAVIVLIAMLVISTPLLGSYMAKVFTNKKAPGDRFFKPVERLIYRITGVNPEGEQRWTTYAISVLAFSLVSVLVLYGMQRLQAHLLFNPDHLANVPAPLSFNTAASFLTNTNWQNYAGEDTMTQFTQMAGLAVQNFVSAAAGIAVAVALIRGLTRNRSNTLGNFWVDLTRIVTRVLIPIAAIAAIILIAQGAVQNLHATHMITTVSGQSQGIPGGPVASQEVIKQLGTNGGGFFNANAAHPFENPTGLTNMLLNWLLLCIPFALAWTFGKMAKDRKQGWPCSEPWAACSSSVPCWSCRSRPTGTSTSPRPTSPRRSPPPRRAATWRARRYATDRSSPPSSTPRRPAPPPDRSTRPTTATPHSVEG